MPRRSSSARTSWAMSAPPTQTTSPRSIRLASCTALSLVARLSVAIVASMVGWWCGAPGAGSRSVSGERDDALLALLVRRIRLAPAGLVGPEDVVVPLLDGACGVDDYEVREQEGLSVRGGADLLVSEARDAPVRERDDDLAILVGRCDALRSD